MGSGRARVPEALAGERPLPTFDVPYFKYIDEEDEEDEWSSRSQSSTEDDSGDSLLSDRYVVVAGTPEKILEHLLSDLHLEAAQDKDTETLLDDFLLTYTVFMTTDDLCQALLRQYPFKKRKVLHLVSQWTSLYKDWLHEDEHLKQFLKTIYRNVLDDVYEYPILEKELKEFQKILGMHRRHTVDEYSPHRKNKTFFHQFSLKESWLQHRGTMNEAEEIFCRVYITEHSYVSVKAQVTASAQEILKIIAEKIQYPEEELALVTVTFSGEKHELQPNDLAISKSFESSSRMFVYRKDLTDSLNPFAENEELQQRSVRILGINTWDLALELTNFDWSLFNAIHEQELIYFTFSRQGSAENTENLSLLLQRCNEVQLWVATEILLCSQLCKRVQLVKKFIKIAAHCKAQRNLNSFFAIVMGLNTASVSRLSQTWEKIPGKFKKLFTELESLTDPSLNHKAYRDAFKKMKSPKIPFMPLLLKDVTFIHEGNKTFLDNLVNFEKLHMIADTVRSLRHCRNNQFGNEVPSKEHHELKPYVHHLHVIDNQQALFELSHRIEPRVAKNTVQSGQLPCIHRSIFFGMSADNQGLEHKKAAHQQQQCQRRIKEMKEEREKKNNKKDNCSGFNLKIEVNCICMTLAKKIKIKNISNNKICGCKITKKDVNTKHFSRVIFICIAYLLSSYYTVKKYWDEVSELRFPCHSGHLPWVTLSSAVGKAAEHTHNTAHSSRLNNTSSGSSTQPLQLLQQPPCHADSTNYERRERGTILKASESFLCSEGYVHLTFEKQEVKLFCIALLGFDPKYSVLQMYCTVKGKQVAPGFRSLRCICQEARRYSPAGLSPGADTGQCCTWVLETHSSKSESVMKASEIIMCLRVTWRAAGRDARESGRRVQHRSPAPWLCGRQKASSCPMLY
ncbi:Rap guanine nucleotide exchange factor 5 [Aix galericulata]|nr:Rap guanine nucleotide exchange factor 5 [Aix galericulata]